MASNNNFERVPSINQSVREKLKTFDINTIEDLLKKDLKYYVETLKLTKVRAQKILKEAKDASFCVFKTAREIEEISKTMIKLSTGVKSLDSITRGGLCTQAITEFSGQFSIGKSQISHQLSVIAQLPQEKGGLDKGVLFIDTEHTYRGARILEIGKRFCQDPQQLLDNLIVIRPNTSDQQIHIIEKVLEDGAKVLDNVKEIGLVIIDSIIARFRSQYIGRESLSLRQQKLNKHLNDLLNFAVKYNAVVVITNQISSVPQESLFGPQTRIVGGHVIAHSATYRFNIKNGKSGARILKILDAPDLPPLEALFEITTEGLVDLE